MKISYISILSGLALGVLAPLLVWQGNPGNMGICAACFIRDTSGALGFQSALAYIRPEIIGIVLGAFIAALFFGKFEPRGGSAPTTRFFFGVFAMLGALVFLGCPWRALLRFGAGDLSAIAGILGLVAGVLAGLWVQFKTTFTLGAQRPQTKATGLLMPIFALALLGLLLLGLGGFEWVKFSQKGPASMHAPLIISLIAGLIIGVVFQKSGFCSVGAIKTLIVDKNSAMMQAIIALLISTALVNLALGQFNLGFEKQPIAHNDMLWNFLAMLLCGLCFTLGGGCPGRQLIKSAEGDNDSAIFVMGLIAGAGIAHNFGVAASPAGLGANSAAAVIIGLVFCALVAIFSRRSPAMQG